MKRRLFIVPLLCTAFFAAPHVHAQNFSIEEIISTIDEANTPAAAAPQETGTPEVPGTIDTTTPPLTESDIEQNITPQYEDKPFAVLQTLDKLTARTSTITLPIGQPASVGPLFIDVKTCKKTPPSEKPEAATFIQVWETKRPEPSKTIPKNRQTTQSESQWVFSGWMFASSPALSAINHPVYDVWLKDCVDNSTPAAE